LNAPAIEAPAQRPSGTRATGVAGAAAAAACGVLAGLQPRLGLGLLALALAGWVAARRPAAIALVLAGVVPITSGLARGLALPSLRISEALTVLLAVTVFVTHRSVRARWTAVDVAAVGYVAAHLVLSLAGAYRENAILGVEAIGVLVGPVQYLLFYRTVVLTGRGERAAGRLLAAFLCGSALVSGVALAQAAGPDSLDAALKAMTGYMPSAGEDEAVARTTSLFPHFQVLSAYLFGVIVLGAAVLATPRATALAPWVVVILVLAASAAVVTTLTVTTTLGTLVAVGVVLRARRVPGRYLAAIAVGMVVLVAATTPLLVDRLGEQSRSVPGTVAADRPALVPQSLAYRWTIWTEQSLPALAGRWDIGAGPVLPDEIEWRSTESFYLTLLFRGGVPLLVVWGVLWWMLYQAAARVARDAGPAVQAAALTLGVVVCVLIPLQLIQPYFTYGGIGHLVWLLAGVVVAARAAAPPAARV
jgi:hypothetical protein